MKKVVSILIAAGLMAILPATSPAASGASAVPAAVAAVPNAYGIAAGGGLQGLSVADRDRSLDEMVTLGVTRVRFDVNWSAVQAGGSSSYNWTSYDGLVNAAVARGLDPLVIIAYTPTWARLPACANDEKCAPANLNDFAAFATTAVNRYKSLGVKEWEIWNEPNIINFWKPAPNAATYAQLLSLAYTAVKAADPSATVISGGTAPASDDGTNIAPVTFLAAMYANGAGGKFDAVGHHPYCYPAAGPTQFFSWSAWSQMADTSPSLRSTMIANGDTAKKIWMTEFGSPTEGPGAVTEASQAQWVTDAYNTRATYSWAGPLFVYQIRDSPSDLADKFGLLRSDWSRKPSWSAYSLSSP